MVCSHWSVLLLAAGLCVAQDATPIPTPVPTPVPTKEVTPMPELECQCQTLLVRTSEDDVEEVDGDITYDSSCLSLGSTLTFRTRHVALRFTGAPMEQGSQIVSASLRLTASFPGSFGLRSSWDVVFDRAGNSQPWSSGANWASRDKTASTRWRTSAQWTSGSVRQSTDLSSILQEVVNRQDYEAGNAVTAIISPGSGHWQNRVAQSFENGNPAQLEVCWMGAVRPPTPPPGAGNAGCGPRVRRAYSTLTCSERQHFADAVATLVRDQPETYWRIVETHQEMEQYAHQTSAFLPWHRQYVLQYENMLRSLPGFECVTVPYWDWERDSSNEARSAPLKNSTFGNMVNHPAGTVQCVDNGLAQSWQLRDGSCLTRQRTGQRFTGEAALALIIDESVGFAEFSTRLEGAPHAAPHVYIGGHMATMQPPADPLFFMHHANVDRLWALWQDYHEYDKVPKEAMTSMHYEPEIRRLSLTLRESEFEMDATMPFAYDSHGSSLPALSRPVTVRDMWTIRDMPDGVSYSYGPDNLAAQLTEDDATVQWDWVESTLTTYRWCCGDGTPDGQEQCDDGNKDDTDGCTNWCRFAEGTRDADTSSASASTHVQMRFANPAVQAKYDTLRKDTALTRHQIIRELALFECSLADDRMAATPVWMRMMGVVDTDLYDQCKVLTKVLSKKQE